MLCNVGGTKFSETLPEESPIDALYCKRAALETATRTDKPRRLHNAALADAEGGWHAQMQLVRIQLPGAKDTGLLPD